MILKQNVIKNLKSKIYIKKIYIEKFAIKYIIAKNGDLNLL